MSGYDWAWLDVNSVEIDDISMGNDQLTWEERIVDLSSFIGQDVTLSWNFDTLDGIFNSELGWQIDDIIVETSPSSEDTNGNGIPDECEVP